MVLIGGRNLLKNILWLQWIAGIGTLLMMFTLGLMLGWTSPFLAKLTAEDSPLPLNMDEASWVASLMNFGRFIGAVIGGVCVAYFGSKQTLMIIGFPLIFGWICVIVANSVIWLYVARLAAGISMGMSFSSFPIFLGEVASPSIRGTLVSLAITGMGLGTVTGNVIGAYISMTIFSYISLVPSIIFTLVFWRISESPHQLIRLGRMEDAKKSIARYNPNADAKAEAESLQNFINTSESLTFKDRLREFNLPRNRKAGIISLMLYFFMQFSGVNSLVFYQELVLIAAKMTIIPPATLVMIAGGVGVVSGWIAVYIADKFRRKTLMIASSAGICVSMGALGTHFALLNNGFDPSGLQWLPIAVMLVFTFSVCSGIATVPNMIVSEIFAPNIKSLAACFASVAVGLYAFVAAKTYLPLVEIVGETWIFWAHAVVMVFAIIFAAIFVPETKGKSLQQIQDELTRK